MVARDYRKLAIAAVRAAAEKKAVDPIILDIRRDSDISDYLVILGTESPAQLRAISESVKDALAQLGVHRLHQDGQSSMRWLALDYGGLVVHILMPEARELYRLEHLWEHAKPVLWEEHAKKTHRPHTAKV